MLQRSRVRWLGRLFLLAGMALFVLLPAAAWADDYPVTSTSTTNPCKTISGNQVCGTVVTVPERRQQFLPFTGGDVALLTVLGLVATGAGAGLVLAGRRRSTSRA
jgi:hypothetical protein